MRPTPLAVLLASALLLSRPPSTAAGQVARGNVEGRVFGTAAVPLPNATITVGGPTIPQPRRSVSDARGLFRVVGLPLGTYSVRIAHLGHRPVTVEGVEVILGRTTSIGELQLEATAVEMAEVVVRASAHPLIDPSDPSVGSNLASAAFTQLPTERSFRSIVTLAPTAAESFFPGDAANIAGGSGLETAWFIDGVNVTDLKIGAGSLNLPYNFVREVAVQAGGYQAEFGRSLGGVVSAVTQSGSNDWHGQLYGFFTNSSLTAAPRYSGAAADLRGFSAYDVGASLGGPVVRDRLWFFAAYNPSFRREHIIVRGLTDVPPDSRTEHVMAGKLTWQPDPNTTVQLTVLGDPSIHHSLQSAQMWDSVGSLGAVYETWHQGGGVVSLTAERQLSPHLRVEGSVAGVTRRDDDEALDTTEPQYFDLRAGYVDGGFYGKGWERGRRLAVRAAATAALSAHTLKAGLEYEDNFLDRMDNTGFEHPGAFGGIERLDSATWAWMRWYAAGKLYNRVATAYAQDGWRVSPRLTLNAGLRWEGQTMISADGKVFQKIMDEWQPRVGFVFQPGALGTQRFFGSYGRFYEQFPLNINVAYGYAYGYSYTTYPQDPRTDTTGGQATIYPFTTAVREPRRDLRGSSFDQVSAGYERVVGRGVRAGLQVMRRKLNWALEDSFNTDSSYSMLGNPGRANLSFVPRAAHRYTALTLTLGKPAGDRTIWNLSYTLSRTRGNYDGLCDYQGAGNCEFPHTNRQFDSRESMKNSTGPLGNDRTHMFRANGSYRVTEGLSLGMVGSLMSGLPRNDIGTTSRGCVCQYLVPRGSAGRSQMLHDLNLRMAYALPVRHARFRQTVQLDLFHVLNPRGAAVMDDVHYNKLDDNGNQAAPNPRYGQGLYYQPPRSVRLGLLVGF